LVRAVVSGKSRMIGFLGFCAKFESDARMLESAIDEAEELGYTIKVMRFRDTPADQATIQHCVELRLAGVIALSPGGHNLEALRAEMLRHCVPVALLDNSLPCPWGIRVVSDDVRGTEVAVEHLAGLGHRRIAYLSSDPNTPLSILRETGYRNAMCGLGLTPDLVHTHWIPGGEAEAVTAFLTRGASRPTAIVCWDDKVAMLVLRAVREQGLQVPKDMSVVGFADLTVAELADPPLTTVAQPFEAMGKTVARELIDRIEGRSTGEPREQLMATYLVERRSSGPVPVM